MDLGTVVWKAVECFKWGLMGHPSKNIKDFVAHIDLYYAVLAQDVLVEKNVSIGPRDCFCAIW